VTESEDFPRSRPNTGRAQARTEAERLRTQARRALELARDVTGEEAGRALKAHAADLLERPDHRGQGET
jgi:DNA repair ATPase RecN